MTPEHVPNTSLRCTSLQRMSCGLIATLFVTIIYLTLIIVRYTQVPSTFEKLLLAWASRPCENFETSFPSPSSFPSFPSPCSKCETFRPENHTIHVSVDQDLSICPKSLVHCATCYDGECLTCSPGYSLPEKGCFFECSEKCKVCDSKDPSYCLECSSSVNGVPPACVDINLCLQSMPNCASCQSAEVCRACKPGYTGSEDGCVEECDPRCAECSDDDANKCTVCADPAAGDPPHCYPEGVCDPDVESLATCMECSKRQCLRCRDGYSMPSTQCRTRCNKNCLTCDQTDSSICTECANSSSLPPDCLPYGECSATNPAVAHCATCNGTICLACAAGWSNLSSNCNIKCADVCATCSNDDPTACNSCKNDDRRAPLCLPRGFCNEKDPAFKNCLECDGDRCIACKPGFSYPEAKCIVACSSLCAECSPHDSSTCLRCADGTRHLPNCLPYGECDIHDHTLKNCLSCDGTACLTCKNGFTDPSTGCNIFCSKNCVACNPDNAKLCTKCVSDKSVPPHCLAPDQCLDTKKYEHCKSCVDERCIECEDGYTGEHCHDKCHAYCASCLPNDANYCKVCSSKETETPYCYPSGTCNPELSTFCVTCVGNKCTACREGMTNVANNCNEVCSDWCRACHENRPNECTICRYRGMEPPRCMPPSMWNLLFKAVQGTFSNDLDMAVIYGLAILMAPLLASYLSGYLAFRRSCLKSEE